MRENEFKIDSYDYDLPKERIAKEPVMPRGRAKLLVYERASGRVTHAIFADLPDILPPCAIIFNDTKVIKARLYGCKDSGGAIEVLLNQPLGGGVFNAFVRGRVRVGTKMRFRTGLSADVVKLCADGSRNIIFNCKPHELFARLENVGYIPLPPYIKRGVKKDDESWYQSYFARFAGAVAAPTASLHFDGVSLSRLRENHEIRTLTLHVGAGTFKGVECDDIRDHKMHSELFALPDDTARLVESGAKILGIGTTVTRVVEFYARRLLALAAGQSVGEICGAGVGFDVRGDAFGAGGANSNLGEVGASFDKNSAGCVGGDFNGANGATDYFGGKNGGKGAAQNLGENPMNFCAHDNLAQTAAPAATSELWCAQLGGKNPSGAQSSAANENGTNGADFDSANSTTQNSADGVNSNLDDFGGDFGKNCASENGANGAGFGDASKTAATQPTTINTGSATQPATTANTDKTTHSAATANAGMSQPATPKTQTHAHALATRLAALAPDELAALRSGACDLFLHPRNQPLRQDYLLTNFHLPRSTLIMLVAAFVGLETTRELYDIAIREGYRFYSYGDGMLIL